MSSRHLLLLVLAAAAVAAPLKVANPELLERLSATERTVLSREGFVGVRTEYDQIYDIYKSAREDGLPVLVTTDPMLHAYHVLYDYSLRTAELERFHAAVTQLLEYLLNHQTALLAKTRDKLVKEALAGNVAFLSVPLHYLRPEFKVPKAAEAKVKAELALIEAHAGFEVSAITGLKDDFSQYVPRGHYTRNEKFERYFKAMMYLGRVGFPTKPASDPELGVKLTRQALLLADALQGPADQGGLSAEALWRGISGPLDYLVGAADDLTPPDYAALAGQLAGSTDLLTWASKDENIRRFIAAAESLPGPQILSGFLTDQQGPISSTKAMKLFGQRFIPDSYMFQQLVYDKVGTQDEPRILPMGLDVMAVLGSGRAREHLVKVYHQDRYAGYLNQLDALRFQFSRLSPGDWNKSAYLGWLYALKLNLEPIPAPEAKVKLARFVAAPAYPDKTLVTSSGSWAELRHDTILYAKQSYTMLATAMPRKPEPGKGPVAWVEPKPDVFDQLAWLARHMEKQLDLAGLENPEVSAKLREFSRLSLELADMARAELAGQVLSAENAETCQNIGKTLANLTTFSQQFEKEFTSEEDEKMALVADVHTDPNSEQVLEVAVGNPCELYATIPHEGREYLAVGACFSYYEFTTPMSERMTDKQWQDLAEKPAMPEWTTSFAPR